MGVVTLSGTVAAFRLFARQELGQKGSERRGAVQVTVRGPAGDKLGGVSLVIELEGGSSPTLKASALSDGTYRSPELAPGRYRVAVVAPCYEKSESDVEVVPGKQATLTISLTPAHPGPGAVACPPAVSPAETGLQFSESGALKAGEISGSVDAAGYSSQAETQGTELRQALGELSAAPMGRERTGNPAELSFFDRGSSLLLHGDYQQAASVFRQGAAQYPHSGRILLGLGVACYSRGRYQDAVGALCQAVDLNPSDRAAYFFLAQTYSVSPVRTEQVLQRLESYATRRPKDAAAQYYYALCLWRSKTAAQSSNDAERVEQLLRSAITLDPSLVEARFRLGLVLSEQGQDTQAMAEFQRTVALRPEWAEAHYRLAQIYRRTGQEGRSQSELADYERLRKQGPTQDQKLRDDLRRLLLGANGS